MQLIAAKHLIDEIIEVEPDEKTSDRNKIAEERNNVKVGENWWIYYNNAYVECKIDTIAYIDGRAKYYGTATHSNLKLSSNYLYTHQEVIQMSRYGGWD